MSRGAGIIDTGVDKRLISIWPGAREIKARAFNPCKPPRPVGALTVIGVSPRPDKGGTVGEQNSAPRNRTRGHQDW